ncbi:unnamed protein product [Zymoseptoria tritici ST99CH_1A5]|uniref:Chaperone/heat shock protein Hsp12 n=2 Tax=Zymoseptoria tritici TaxID=1047171 RepID=A0A1X7RTG9_ZYMT9|nr:unnamed protein product [Zymoseptoria tritici ST99CH_3D7]SMR53794.1 unnamed protein product [Zymoseptoria tritici ST99CH_3D1]SMY24369.1 unnamed protein product [Zymoseptoria tritici ST99CH_1A5]
MSDALRQSNTDKIGSAVKPDSQKGTLESATDSLKSAGDSIAGTAQPEGEKSATQKASDTVSGSGKDAGKEGQSYLDSAKEAIGMGDKK